LLSGNAVKVTGWWVVGKRGTPIQRELRVWRKIWLGVGGIFWMRVGCKGLVRSGFSHSTKEFVASGDRLRYNGEME